MDMWLTTSDESVKLEKQVGIPDTVNSPITNEYSTIEINTFQEFQKVDGFGFSLTGGSAYVINQLPSTDRKELLEELFGSTSEGSIGISYLRLSIGASDLNDHVFSYDDMPDGETDVTLSHFSLAEDEKDLIPLLQEIIAINPTISIIATPWSAPVWMKSMATSIGGTLLKQYYATYAQYFVLYIQQMWDKHNIRISAVTPQNEPLNPYNNPSMYMSASEQNDFIHNYLGPTFQATNMTTKIIVYDHNCDNPSYPLEVLTGDINSNYIHGSAFHLYAGDVSILSSIHEAYPTKVVYLTEQWTSSDGAFGDDLMWGTQYVVIGSLSNWAAAAFEWNLANDPTYEPHTDGGCTMCKGALTIDTSQADTTGVQRNVAYYIIAHASKFIYPNAVRVSSEYSSSNSSHRVENIQCPSLISVSFGVKETDSEQRKVVVLVGNLGTHECSFNLRVDGDKWVAATMPGRSVATYTLYN